MRVRGEETVEEGGTLFVSTHETTEMEGRTAERIRKRAVWGGVSLQNSLGVLHHHGESHHPRVDELVWCSGPVLSN